MADGHGAGDGGEDRILTLPNAITTIRLALIPVYVILLAQPHKAHWEAAAWLLAGIGATDFLDGQLARRLGQVSTVGKVLDPIADRVLLATAIISTIAVDAVPLWVAIIAIAREALVAGGFLYVATKGGRRMDVSWPGKAGAFGLMVALPFFLNGHSHAGWHHTSEDLAWVAAIPGLILGWYSAILYVPAARKALAEARAADATTGAEAGAA